MKIEIVKPQESIEVGDLVAKSSNLIVTNKI